MEPLHASLQPVGKRQHAGHLRPCDTGRDGACPVATRQRPLRYASLSLRMSENIVSVSLRAGKITLRTHSACAGIIRSEVLCDRFHRPAGQTCSDRILLGKNTHAPPDLAAPRKGNGSDRPQTPLSAMLRGFVVVQTGFHQQALLLGLVIIAARIPHHSLVHVAI